MWKFVSGELDVPRVSSQPLKRVETEGGLDTLMTAEGTFPHLPFIFPVRQRDN